MYRAVVFALFAVTLAASPVAAQDAKAVEVTPYVALGTGGVSPVGAAVTFPVSSTLSVETDVAYRRGEGRIHALVQAPVSCGFCRASASRHRMSPVEWDCRGPGRHGSYDSSLIGTQSRLAMTINAGGSLKMPVNDKVDAAERMPDGSSP